MFGISRQAIYQQEIRSKQKIKEKGIVLELVLNKRRLMPRLGTRKLYYLLQEEFVASGIKMGRDALFASLREKHLLIQPKKSYTQTTFSKHWLHKHPNLLKHLKPNQAEQVYVSDITYVKSKERTHYLSLITDAYSRKIVGYNLSDNMEAVHVAKALQQAIKNRYTTSELIHHSDRGLQYCSAIYQNILSNNKIRSSMTDGYDCY